MKNIVADIISKKVGLKAKDVGKLIEIPPKDDLGDYAFPCFILAKKEKKNPLIIAEGLAEKFRKNLPKEISNVNFNGGYVNFFIDKNVLAKNVLSKVGEKGFGGNGSGKGKKIVIEFSQPNTHKAFHVGHIRGTSLGESLARIFEFEECKVIRVNYSGDTGMHIAKWIWGYNKYHSKEKLRNDESWIAGIYVEAVKKIGDSKKFQGEVEEINRKIESKEDKGINDLWSKTRKMSIESWGRIYGELNTHFDKDYFESEFEEEARKICLDLLKKKIAKKDDAVFMDLKKEGLGVWVILRRDGAVLYSAKDIALAKKKVKDFPADRYLVAVAAEQKLHFEQLKRTLELMKFPRSKVYDFLTFGMVRFPDGKMSSRTGDNVFYSDFVKKVADSAKEGIKDRSPGAKNLEERSMKIAVAAIKYSMLKQDSKKNIIFDRNQAISFEGDTGPYLLYSYARASSIGRKVKSKKAVKIVDLKDVEIRLLKKIDSFPDVVAKAYENLAPNLIANYCFELSKLFNEFYHSCPVLGSIEEGFRLKLVEAFRVTLGKGMNLLGIEVLEEM